jgi:hypothetical protein
MADASEALRKAYIALLEAANYANENGSKEYETFFDDAAAEARLVLQELGVIKNPGTA